MFSKRTQWTTIPNRISLLVEQKRRRGETIIDLTESNPTICGFDYPEKEILSALSQESVMKYKPEPRGLLQAREALSAYYTSFGIYINPEQIVFTSSTREAYSFLFKLLCNVGDNVLIPRPSYPLLEFLSQINDIEPKQYRLIYDGEWHIDFESLKMNLTNRTKAILLVHPNNPTGSYITQKEFDEICNLAAEHQCAIIIDEVFLPYSINSDNPKQYILEIPDSVLTFSLNGISKLIGLPQLKLSWIIIQGNSQFRAEVLNRLDILTDTFLSVNTPVQFALPTLLKYAPDIQKQILSRIRSNYTSLLNCFAQSKGSILNTEGGWYGILKLPQKQSDEDLILEFLMKANILLFAGHLFELEQHSTVITSLLPPTNTLQEALREIFHIVE